MAARTRDGADAVGVITGAAQAEAEGLIEAVADGFGDGLVAPGPDPHAIGSRKAAAATKASRMRNTVIISRRA
jgi:ethanolamine utilization protein EutA (predicted chaperonin)